MERTSGWHGSGSGDDAKARKSTGGGAGIGSAAGGAIGAAAGGMIEGPLGAVMGLAVGGFLGGITGAAFGYSSRAGADRVFAGDHADLIGYNVLDVDGGRVGKVACVFVDEVGRAAYLGVSTTWLGIGPCRVVPLDVVEFLPRGRRLRLPFPRRAVRGAPSSPRRDLLEPKLEEDVRRWFEPYLPPRAQPWRGAIHAAEVETGGDGSQTEGLHFSGDAAYAQDPVPSPSGVDDERQAMTQPSVAGGPGSSPPSEEPAWADPRPSEEPRHASGRRRDVRPYPAEDPAISDREG